MEFADDIKNLAKRLSSIDPNSIQTEEATKTAMIMPFIMALGYDVFNHEEVVPEYTADYGLKKGEKVDYAVMRDGKPVILFECKINGDHLNANRCSQLSRYFTNSEARIAVLTNGIIYKFYSDLEQLNKMDQRPFMVIDLLDLDEQLIPELKKLHKNKFNLETTLSTASELKYVREIKKIFSAEIGAPSEPFVKFFTVELGIPRFTHTVKEQFTGLVKKALNDFLLEKMTDDFESFVTQKKESESPIQDENYGDSVQEDDGVVTSEDEWEGYYIVKAIMRRTVDVSRITIRDTKSYCGILLDDNNRKPICRLRFNRSQKYLSLIGSDKKEERIPIENIDDIYKYADKLREAIKLYD